MRLSQMTCEEVRTYFQESDMALLTVGCLENHGSHNVLGVDTLVPEKLLSMIEEKVRIASCAGDPLRRVRRYDRLFGKHFHRRRVHVYAADQDYGWIDQPWREKNPFP